MKNSKRIFRILKLISKIWKANPDLRLSQLFLNAVREEDFTYWLEDENLETYLMVYYTDFFSKKYAKSIQRIILKNRTLVT